MDGGVDGHAEGPRTVPGGVRARDEGRRVVMSGGGQIGGVQGGHLQIDDPGLRLP